MVFFSCGVCGESLKKAQVEKHLLHCRSFCLSCIDCGKDFSRETYRNHVRCISEDQKYGGKEFQARASKGDVKQQQWMERIQQALDQSGLDPRLQRLLDQISSYDNVPRKRAKFQNWLKNSLKIRDELVMEQLWKIFSDSSQSAAVTQAADSIKKEDECGGVEQQKRKSSDVPEDQTRKKKKRERDESEEGVCTESTGLVEQEEVDSQSGPEGRRFSWKGTIKQVLRAAPEDGLAVKKLRKKVLAAFHTFSSDGQQQSKEELLTIFNKKLSGSPKFCVLKERVTLVK